jgi:hypothetical protein
VPSSVQTAAGALQEEATPDRSQAEPSLTSQEPRKTLPFAFCSARGDDPEPTSSGVVQVTSVFASSAGGRLPAKSNVFLICFSLDLREGKKARNFSEQRPLIGLLGEVFIRLHEQVDVEAVAVIIVRRRMSKRGVRFHNAVRPVRL